MSKRYSVFPAVYVAVIKDNQILLTQRCNTGYMDGYYDLPAGHLERGESLLESAARELKEETGLIVKANNLKLAHIFLDEQTSDKTYLAFMFVAKKWSGDPINMEPELSSNLSFFDIDNLPLKVRPHSLEMLKGLKNDDSVKLSYFEPGRFN